MTKTATDSARVFIKNVIFLQKRHFRRMIPDPGVELKAH